MNHSSPDNVGSRWTAPWFHLVLLALCTLLAYGNSLTVPLQLDDNQVLGKAFSNASSGGLNPFAPGSARWLADLTFALNRSLHGFQVTGYHVINLVIHGAAAFTLYGLLSLLTKPAADDAGSSFLHRFVPLTTALLFVSHPIQTEAVTYITQRYTSLATLCYLLALYCYLLARRAMTEASLPHRQLLFRWVPFLVAALAAMKCKQISATLPLLIALLELIRYRGALLKKPAFVLLLTLLLAVVPLQEIAARTAGAPRSVGQLVQQASSETATIPRQSYFLTEQRVQATYLRLLLLPIRQNLDYDYPLSTSLADALLLAAIMLHLLLLATAITLLRRANAQADSHQSAGREAERLIGLGIIWFYLTLAVESSFIPIRDVIYEHRLYLPSTGFFLAVSSAGGRLLIRRPALQRTSWLIVGVLIIVLSGATMLRNRVWQSELGLWQDVVAKSPAKARARFVLATYYVKQGMVEQAVANFVRAIEREPERDTYRIHLNDTIAMIDGFSNRALDGKTYHSSSEQIDPARRTLWQAVSFNNLGLAYEMLNNPARAMECYQQATTLNPRFDLAWLNLALLAARQNDRITLTQAQNVLRSLAPHLLTTVPPR